MGWRVDSRKEQGLFSESGGRIGISCCRALIRDPTVAIRSGHCAGRRRPEQWRPRRRHWSTSSELVSGAIQAILKQTKAQEGGGGGELTKGVLAVGEGSEGCNYARRRKQPSARSKRTEIDG
jgi:hypothetical protein